MNTFDPTLALEILVFEQRSFFFHLPLLIIALAVVFLTLFCLAYSAGLFDQETFFANVIVLLIVAAFLIILSFGSGLILRVNRRVATAPAAYATTQPIDRRGFHEDVEFLTATNPDLAPSPMLLTPIH